MFDRDVYERDEKLDEHKIRRKDQVLLNAIHSTNLFIILGNSVYFK